MSAIMSHHTSHALTESRTLTRGARSAQRVAHAHRTPSARLFALTESRACSKCRLPSPTPLPAPRLHPWPSPCPCFRLPCCYVPAGSSRLRVVVAVAVLPVPRAPRPLLWRS